MKELYICVGCKQVHYDNDYCEKDGDYKITKCQFDAMLNQMGAISEELNGERKLKSTEKTE